MRKIDGILTKHEYCESLKKEHIYQFTKNRPLNKLYMALISGSGGKFGLDRNWQHGELFPAKYKVGDVIEVGWTISGVTERLYFVVLADIDETKVFCKFAKREGTEYVEEDEDMWS